jgi:hypothetical protein
MRKIIAVATVAGLILGAASAVSAEDWNIGFGGVYNSNFGGGFKGNVSSPVYDTLITKIMPTFISTTTIVRNETMSTTTTVIPSEPPVVIVGDTILVSWDTVTVNTSGKMGTTPTETKEGVRRKAPDRKEMFTPHYGGGGEMFFAAKYAEATVGLSFIGGTWKGTVFGKDSTVSVYRVVRTVYDTLRTTVIQDKDSVFSFAYDSSRVMVDDTISTSNVSMDTVYNWDMSAMNVNVGLWLKYPYDLTDAFKLFPMLGIEYEMCAVITKGIREIRNAYSWSRTWFKAGVGSDIYLGGGVYVHPVVLYGIGWKNSVERGIMKEAGNSGDTKISHGFTARVGIGYMFDFD